MTSVSGAAAVVTGGRRGLGKALTAALLSAGASRVYATARHVTPHDDPRVVPLSLDVTDRDSVRALADVTRDASILINNAGGNERAPLTSVADDAMRKVFEINVFGLLRVTQELAPTLGANGGGAVVNILSVQSFTAGAGVYGASKAAAWSLTNSLRSALADQSTQVLGAHLSYTDTDMTRDLDVVKNSAADVARLIVDALQAGDAEVLVDDSSRAFKAALSGPVEGLQLQLIEGQLRPTDL